MNFQPEFNTEEWALLKITPLVVSSAIMTAGHTSLTQNMLEIYSMGEAITHPENFGELAAEVSASLKAANNSDQLRISDPAEVKPKAIQMCQQVAALLPTKVSAEEVLQYKKWILFVACKVAKAAKEGSFLGIGGKRVSCDEELVLNDLTQALGLDHLVLAQFLAEHK